MTTNILFLDIVFQSGEFYPQNANSSFWDGLIGALIGAISAFLVYYLGTIRENEKEVKIKNENESNILVYFSSSIQSIIQQSEGQIKLYEKHSKNIASKPFEFHALPIVVSEDLNRIVNKFDHEKVFNAYLNKFTNSNENIKKFQKIYTQIDSILKLYELANFSQEAYIKELLDRLTRYKDLSEEKILNYCSMLINKIKNSNEKYNEDPFYNLLDKALIYYNEKLSDPITLTFIQTGFIEKIKAHLERDFRHLEEGLIIDDNCRKATWLYYETIERTTRFSNTFNNFSLDLKKVTDSLKELTIDLKV